MKSIALVTELFYPSIGGQEYRFFKLARGLLKRGFKVDVYTTDHTGGSLQREEDLAGVHVVRYIKLRNYVKPGSRSIGQLAKYVVTTRNLLKNIIKEYDAILVNQMPIAHLFLLPNKRNVFVDWCEVYRKGTLKHLVALASKRFDKGTGVSEIIVEEILRNNPNMILEVVRTPLDIDRYMPTKEKNFETILYVGRLVPHKNILPLADSVVYLNEKLRYQKKLVIVGDGPFKQIIAEKYRNYKYIEVLGGVDEDTKIELLRRAFILAIPSYREGFPNVVAEAIASLTPILTIRSPLNNVHPFIERHKIGFVAPSPSPKHLAETIASISKEEWKYAVDNEMKLREEFREEINIDKLVRFISAG